MADLDLSETFLSIGWALGDIVIALAARLPEYEGWNTLDLLQERLTPEVVGVSDDEVRMLAEKIRWVLREISISRGWEVIEESLNCYLGYTSAREARGEHPNSPRPTA